MGLGLVGLPDWEGRSSENRLGMMFFQNGFMPVAFIVWEN
jgi:hypothetical protein